MALSGSPQQRRGLKLLAIPILAVVAAYGYARMTGETAVEPEPQEQTTQGQAKTTRTTPTTTILGVDASTPHREAAEALLIESYAQLSGATGQDMPYFQANFREIPSRDRLSTGIGAFPIDEQGEIATLDQPDPTVKTIIRLQIKTWNERLRQAHINCELQPNSPYPDELQIGTVCGD